MRVEVTWEDTVDGEPGNVNRCAIAKAINRQYPHLTHVKVGASSISFSNKRTGLRYVIATPRSALKHIKEFDKGNKDTEFPSFILRLDEAETKPITQATEIERAKLRDYQRRYIAETGGKPKAPPAVLRQRRKAARAR